MPGWLDDAAFHLFSTPVTWTEVIADLTGLLCVWWVARQVIWNWPAGLANNVFFLLLFTDAKLYGDAALQVVFFVLGVYGWVQWRNRRARVELPVRVTTAAEWRWLGVAAGLGWAACYLWLDRVTDSPVPFWDSLVLILSLVATYGQTKKLVESWWVWIAVDLISIPLYVSRDLVPTAGLYVVFLVLCVIGLRDWQRSLRPASPPVAAVAT